MSADAERLAWAYLSRVAEPPCPTLNAWVHAVGPVEAAARVRAGAEPAAITGHVEARRKQTAPKPIWRLSTGAAGG